MVIALWSNLDEVTRVAGSVKKVLIAPSRFMQACVRVPQQISVNYGSENIQFSLSRLNSGNCSEWFLLKSFHNVFFGQRETKSDGVLVSHNNDRGIPSKRFAVNRLFGKIGVICDYFKFWSGERNNLRRSFTFVPTMNTKSFYPGTQRFRRSLYAKKKPWSFDINNSLCIQTSSIRSLPRLATLPSNSESGQYDCPSCNAFRPAKEFVPPWQVVSSICAFFYAAFLLFCRRSESGAIFCAVVFILIGGAMLLIGHERYEDYAPYKSNDPTPETKQFLHNRENVSQKPLTQIIYL